MADIFNFEIYWDDSGTNKESPIAVAAAYVARTQQWEHFVRNWDEVAREEGFEFFHMADFMARPEARKKPYCDWSAAKKTRVYYRLTNIINMRVSMGFAIAIPKASYDKFAPEHFRREYADTHYGVAVKTCMGLVDQWHEQFARGEQVRYIFDQMGKGKGELEDVWKMITELPAEWAKRGGIVPGGYCFEDKRLYKPLQAADILAWNQYSHMKDIVLKGLPDDNPRPYFRVLRENRPMKLGFFSDDNVQQMFATMMDYESRTGKRAYAVPSWKKTLQKNPLMANDSNPV